MVNEMVERKEPRLVQFAEGEVVEGVMLSMSKFMVRDPEDPDNEAARKPVMRVLVKDDDGELQAFHCTYDLLQKLHAVDCGHRIQVKYQGEDHSVRRGNNSLKRFSVKVSKYPAVQVFGDRTRDAGADETTGSKGRQLEDGTFVSDNDIPF